MDFKTIQRLAADDMAKVDANIQSQLNSDVALINQLGFYIISGGGKRLRPLLAILSAKALDYQGEQHVLAAAFIEFIHTATLLHDDVVDESHLRRGKATANAAFGNAASVLVGDFIYTRAFQMMTELGSLEILKLMSDAVNTIAEGEVLQLINCNDPSTTEQSYLQVIYSKTARLFEAATQIGAILSDSSAEITQAMQTYGRHLGTAFQLVDDVMDYASDSQDMGKNVGDDLAEGKPTLPLIHALAHCNDDEKALITDAIKTGNGMADFAEIMTIIQKYQSLDYTKDVAIKEANLAIDALSVIPASDFKQALISLAHLSVHRNS